MNQSQPTGPYNQIQQMAPGQPLQQIFQQPQNTAQAMQQQQPRPITLEEYNRQVDELAENKYKIRAQEVVNNAVSAMKGVMEMFNQQPQQQQCQQESFWDTTTGKVAIGGIGGGLGIAGYKLISKVFGGNSSSSYTPSPQELNTVGEALKTLFGR